MANVLRPGSIPHKKYEKTPRLAFKQMELIELFIDSVKAFGVPDEERFQTVDLYEEQSLYQVLICLQTLARKVCVDSLVALVWPCYCLCVLVEELVTSFLYILLQVFRKELRKSYISLSCSYVLLLK